MEVFVLILNLSVRFHINCIVFMKYLTLLLFVSTFLVSCSNDKNDNSKINLDIAKSKSIDSLRRIVDSLTNKNSEVISNLDTMLGTVVNVEPECLGTSNCPISDIDIKIENRIPGWDMYGIAFIGNSKWVARGRQVVYENDPN